MTRISLFYREESESTTYDNSDIINDTNVSDIRTDEVTETISSNEVEFESLRNYDKSSSENVVINLESLELKFNELLTSQLVTQNKLDELIVIQKQQYAITFSLFIGLALIVILTIMYKVITFSFF